MAKVNFDKIPNKALGSNIFCSREIQKKFYSTLNENPMSALNN